MKSESCPFITKLYAIFQTRYSAHFVMEYVCGGDLSDFILNYTPIDYESTKDIKPENILMDHKSDIWITNFGLAVAGLYDYKITTGMAGRRGYAAPEAINSNLYQFEPDWFSLGLVTYNLVTQQMPFATKSMDDCRSSVNFTTAFYLPEMDTVLKDLIEGLS